MMGDDGCCPQKSQNDDLWMVCDIKHNYFHKYKVLADAWDGGKCLSVS